MTERRKLAFLCVANSARSQMAEGWVRHLYSDHFDAVSAGSAPGRLHPMAVTVMAEVGVDLRSHFSKGLDSLDFSTVDLAVTLCAAEACPVLPEGVVVRHVPFDDPAAVGATDAEALESFRAVRDQLRDALHTGLHEGAWFPFGDGDQGGE